MSRLSQTWKQKRSHVASVQDLPLTRKEDSLDSNTHDEKQRTVKTKYLGRHQVKFYPKESSSKEQATPRRSQRLNKSFEDNGRKETCETKENRRQDCAKGLDIQTTSSKTMKSPDQRPSQSPNYFNLSGGFDVDDLCAVDAMEQQLTSPPPVRRTQVPKLTSPPLREISQSIIEQRSNESSEPMMSPSQNTKPVLSSTPVTRNFPCSEMQALNKVFTSAQQQRSPELLSPIVLDSADSANQRRVSTPMNEAEFSRAERDKTPEETRRESTDKIDFTNNQSVASSIGMSANSNSLSSSILTPADCLSLASWGLPASILVKYHELGINTMFEWQAECLCKGNVLKGGNLVYSAPTSAGKTMVAEILMLKRVLETKRKALFILPFVSVAREKMFFLQRLFQEAGVRVEGYMGNQNPAGGFASLDIAVCTIEKANSLINRLMEEGKISQLGMIVVDELHMIGDTSRGYLLELLLTKILYVTGKHGNRETNTADLDKSAPSISIIGMSATLPNLDMLAKWLSADLYYTAYRPVPLTEMIKVGTVIYDTDMVKLYDLSGTAKVAGDDDHVIPLCKETLVDGHSVLIFCPTKNWCEKLSESIAKHFAMVQNMDKAAKEDTTDTGFVKGVNLPARRVIIRTPMFHGKVVDPWCTNKWLEELVEKELTPGESILVCKSNEKQKAATLVRSQLQAVKSCLIDSKVGSGGIKRALLEVIVSGVASSPQDLEHYAACTFFANGQAREEENKSDSVIKDAIKYLVENEFIRLQQVAQEQAGTDQEQHVKEKFCPTQLGSATLASALSPDEALVVFAELQKARRSFVLENELHIIYQVTPIYIQDQWANMDWYQYLRIWESLPSHMRRVADLVGVEESFLARGVRGLVQARTDAQRKVLAIHQRFYTAMALQDLVHEVPLNHVARRYGANKGMLQGLQSAAATFAGMVTVFCQRLGWINLELLLSQFQSRLTFGVARELCDLVRISLLNGSRARTLYNAGYHTIASISSASPEQLEALLRNSSPFQSNRKRDGETEFEIKERAKLRSIWVTGRRGLTELGAAKLIIEEAQTLLRHDAAQLGIQWNPEQRNAGAVGVGDNSSDSSNNSEDMNRSSTSVLPPKRRNNIGTQAF